MSWLPPARQRRPQAARSFQPRLLADADLSGFRYVIIDEIVELTVGLVVSEWPRVDEQGRLRFVAEPLLLGADADLFQRFLRAHRLPRELAERPLRIGDTFAVEVLSDARAPSEAEDASSHRLEPVVDPARWMKPPIYDITAEARDAAKLSFYAAVTPTVDSDEAQGLAPLTDR